MGLSRTRRRKTRLQRWCCSGAEQKAIETAKNFLSENLSVEQVARCTGLSLETVQNLAKEKK